MNMPRDISGRWIALAIVVLTLAGAVSSIWHHHVSSNAAQEFLGTGGMVLVTQSPRAELLVLVPNATTTPVTANDSITIGGREMRIARRHDLTAARGMLNLRHALRQDASYEFDAVVALDPPWTFAIRLADDERSLTLAFDPVGRRVAVAETGRVAALAEKTAAGLATFFGDFKPRD
jgi:hypothetical protein